MTKFDLFVEPDCFRVFDYKRFNIRELATLGKYNETHLMASDDWFKPAHYGDDEAIMSLVGFSVQLRLSEVVFIFAQRNIVPVGIKELLAFGRDYPFEQEMHDIYTPYAQTIRIGTISHHFTPFLSSRLHLHQQIRCLRMTECMSAQIRPEDRILVHRNESVLY
jgi:hypothetical protein